MGVKKNSDSAECWVFNFVLESESGALLEREKPDQLMDVIIKWAESNGCQVGGGYSECENLDDDDLYELRK